MEEQVSPQQFLSKSMRYALNIWEAGDVELRRNLKTSWKIYVSFKSTAALSKSFSEEWKFLWQNLIGYGEKEF